MLMQGLTPNQQRVLPLLRIVCRLFAMLPLRRGRVLFTSYPDGADNAYAMFRYLRETEPQLEFVWLVDDRGDLADRLAGARLVKRKSLAALLAFSTAEMVFHTHGVFRFAAPRNGQTVVNLWHGMPLKTIGTYDRPSSAPPTGHFGIATSKLFQGVIARAFRIPEDRVLVTGQPRYDLLFLNGRAEPPLALWMPTYRISDEGDIRSDSSFSPESFLKLLAELDPLLAARGTRVTLKLHPMDLLNCLLKPQYVAIDIIFGHEPGVIVEDLLAQSRCLVTDYSSAAVDFAVLNRPIGFFCPDRGSYTRGFIPEVEDAYFDAGTMLQSAEDLASFFADTPIGLVASRAQLVEHCDAKNSERLWRALSDAGALTV